MLCLQNEILSQLQTHVAQEKQKKEYWVIHNVEIQM